MPQILRVVANRVTVHDHAARQWCHAAEELVAYPEQILRRLTVKHAAGPDAGVDKNVVVLHVVERALAEKGLVACRQGSFGGPPQFLGGD